MSETIRTDEKPCPQCGNINDSLTKVTDIVRKPSYREGDFTVCAYCGCISRFDRKLNLVKAKEEDLEEIKRVQPKEYKMLIAAALFFASALSPLNKAQNRRN